MIFVDGENATVADPVGPVTAIVVPDTDAMDPLTSSSPLTLAGAWDAAVADVAFGAVEESLGGLLLDEPHATAYSAAIPTIASTE